MVQQNSLLVMLVQLVEHIPTPPPPAKPSKRRPAFYPDTLFLKALVIMIVKHLHYPYELLCVLEIPSREMQALRRMLIEGRRDQTGGICELLLHALCDYVPVHIGCLYRQ